MIDVSQSQGRGTEQATQIPPITIIVPVLNEGAFIEECLLSLLPQIRADIDEILVVDGGSQDETCGIVQQLQSRYSAVRLVHNPQRLQSAAVNLGARAARPESSIIVRADAHASYPPNFVYLCVSSLIAKRADSVVVPMLAKGEAPFQRAVAAAQNSLIGNGGSSHRRTDRGSKFVDHGHHAAFNREKFRALGGYNETFTHNEDAEYDHRLISSGGRIWMCSEACITYFPRTTWGALARQYFNHGRGRAQTLLLHRQKPKLRQLIPPMALIGCASGAFLGIFYPVALSIPGLYLALLVCMSVVQSIRERDTVVLAQGLAAGTMHLSWGAGFLKTFFARFAKKVSYLKAHSARSVQ